MAKNYWNYAESYDGRSPEEEREFFLMAGDLLSEEERKAKKAEEVTVPESRVHLSGNLKKEVKTEPAGWGVNAFFTPSGLGETAMPDPVPVLAQRSITVKPPVKKLHKALSVNIEEKKVRFGKKTLLRDIRFAADYSDFVLILGGSGAGKTTLVKAILGESRATGKILLDGTDLYDHFDDMKVQIGLVPQFLTLRQNDTVKDTVMDAARIKLDRMFNLEEIGMRVDNVLKKVGIKELEGSLIANLSGGQKKKVAVAVQLVGFQKVFIFDEPDSGLDAASRVQLMDLLKEISDSGKIVMVITHYPDDALELFTKVIVIAKDSRDKAGHMAFYGDVDGALKFFAVSRLQDIMMEINPSYEGGKGNADAFIQKYGRMVAAR